MKKETWVLLFLASVLLVLGVVRAVRSPAAAAGAPSAALCQERVPSDENGTSTGCQKALESAGANDIDAASELHLRQLETATEAQRMKQQEAANELLRRRQHAAHPLS
jgi:hypothetical protein